jgi:hypothetical protein
MAARLQEVLEVEETALKTRMAFVLAVDDPGTATDSWAVVRSIAVDSQTFQEKSLRKFKSLRKVQEVEWGMCR